MPVLTEHRFSVAAYYHIAARRPGLHVHPYTVGLSLGRQIRFSAPLEQITAELAEVTRKPIASS